MAQDESVISNASNVKINLCCLDERGASENIDSIH